MSLFPATNEKRPYEQLLHYSNRPSRLPVMIGIFQNIAPYQKRKGDMGAVFLPRACTTVGVSMAER